MRAALGALSPWNRVLLVALVAQAAILAADRLFEGEELRPFKPITGTRIFPALDPGTVTRLRLTGGGRTTVLERRGEAWVVENEGAAPADPDYVAVALDAIVQLAPGPVVSENPERHEAYEVEGPLALDVVFEGVGGEIGRFVCGRSTPNGRGFYLRYPADSDLVMLVEPNLRDAFVRSGNALGAWREKKIFDDDSRRVRKLEIINHQETILLERVVPEGVLPGDQDEWKMVRPETAAVTALVGGDMAKAMSELKADGFYSGDQPLAELGLDPPRVRVIAHLDDGTTRSLELGEERNNQVYARVTGREEIYRVPLFRVYHFLKRSAELR